MVPLSPLAYRYQTFDRTMIPKAFQPHGEAFWWGALQYYVFMHMHRGIWDKYIQNDAFRDDLIRVHGAKMKRVKYSHLSRDPPLNARSERRRRLGAAVASTIAGGDTNTVVAESSARTNHFEQRRHFNNPRTRPDASKQRNSVAASSQGPGPSSLKDNWTRTVPNGKLLINHRHRSVSAVYDLFCWRFRHVHRRQWRPTQRNRSASDASPTSQEAPSRTTFITGR